MDHRLGHLAKPHKAIAGKQRDLDFFLAIFPLAQAPNGQKERLNPLFFQLVPHHLLMARFCAQGIPTSGLVGLIRLIDRIHLDRRFNSH
jgi:hypothetical protein